ncbi:phage protein [Caldimonas brevitalea]|uniref:Phage protein n=2 Tax=Caldimonas brevitalea TaxID=413882 RepID=A0A0G3BN86_9BURK|nr:phage protein [Caldimonas brevitalea]
MSSYYVVSVNHTHRRHKYITFWRPDDRGYCWALSNAGKYAEANIRAHLGYYNSGCSSIAVRCQIVDPLGVAPIPGHHDFDAGPVVENTRANWKVLLANMVTQPQYKPHPLFKGARRAEWEMA